MKRKILQNLMKKTVAGTLAAGMLLSGVCFLPTVAAEVRAEEAARTDDGVYATEAAWIDDGVHATEAAQAATSHAEKLDISKYQDATAPKPTAKGYEGWVFAGWYKEEACTTPITTKPKTGSCWAKFVPAEVLSVKCQMLSGTTESSATSKLRLVSSVDTLNYSKAGFEIQYGESDAFSYETSTVWKTIKAKEGGVAFKYVPSDICEASNYFTTLTLSNIPSSEYATGIYIAPYWETLDGTKVYGESRFARVEDGYLNVVNVPVRLYADKEVAAGLIEVDYDENTFEYCGMDTGKVFEVMDSADTGSVIRCIGNVADITKNAQADGLFANLRFKVKNGASISKENTFAVSNEEFCDKDEEDVTLEVADVVYKTLQQK